MTPLFDIAKQAAADAIVEELALRDDEARIELIEWLSALRLGRHMYFLNRSYAANVLWPELEQRQNTRHILLSAARSFHLSVNTTVDNGYSCYCRALAAAMTSMTAPYNHSKSVTDQEFASKIPSVGDTEKLLNDELWLTFIVTLELQVSRFFTKDELSSGGRHRPKETVDA